MYNDPRAFHKYIFIEVISLGDRDIRPEFIDIEGINNVNFGWGDRYVINLVEEKFKSEAITHRIENATADRPLGKLPEESREIKSRILRHINKDISEKIKEVRRNMKDDKKKKRVTDAIIRNVEIAMIGWMNCNMNTCHRNRETDGAQPGDVATTVYLDTSKTKKRKVFKRQNIKKHNQNILRDILRVISNKVVGSLAIKWFRNKTQNRNNEKEDYK